MARKATVDRKTGETEVSVSIDLDGSGKATIATGVGFFDHMLNAFARHGVFDLEVSASGDLEIDEHHTVEDVAIVMGRAILAAVGERKGIVRVGTATVPLDEALASVTIDVSGRGYAVFSGQLGPARVGELDPILVPHFIETLAREGALNVHASILAGQNDHHKIEALFKALGRALDAATRIDARLGGSIPSTKGTLG